MADFTVGVSYFCFCFLSVCSEVTTDEDRVTPEPIIPEEIEVEVNYEPDPTDLVLSSVPGGELFDPRKHKFSEGDLKPQPMIKKAKKVFVPDEQKVCWQLDEEDHKKMRFQSSRLLHCVYVPRGKSVKQEDSWSSNM